MEFLIIICIVAGTFGVCWLVDRGFSRIFRGKPQHKTGKSVRLSKKYGAVGTALAAVGVAAVVNGVSYGGILLYGGLAVLALGAALIVYYMTFGLFYDDDSFILTTFGRKSEAYRFRQIRSQQLFASYGSVIIELYLDDGRTVQLQSGMEGVYPFLDAAFAGWLRQTGRKKEDCSFYDPENSCWFPKEEER